MSDDITGIHHVTAIAGDPQRNVDFYTRLLGMRLVKLTVNFDAPDTYHLYYGDNKGSPGTLLTFFPWPGGRTGRAGTGQVTVTSWSIPIDAVGFWVDRFKRSGVDFTGPAGQPDCIVNLYDFAYFALNWANCTRPYEPGCEDQSQ